MARVPESVERLMVVDFTPLDFAQRFVGTLDDDGSAIRGARKINHGDAWAKDFELRLPATCLTIHRSVSHRRPLSGRFCP